MKRTSTSSTQKAQSDLSVRANNDALAKLTVGKLPGENSVNANAKSVSPEVNRRVRTSAAMIGLAISMGASGLLLPQQTEEVIAAESNQGSEPTVTTLPNISEKAPVAPENAALEVKPEMRTVVSPLSLGQAKAIKVSTRQAPLFNQKAGLSGDQNHDLNTPLRQSTASSQRENISEKQGSSESKISISKPSVVKTAAVVAEELKTDNTPAKSSRSESVDNKLKVKQDAALSRLKQQRQRLQNSLSLLQTDAIDHNSTQNKPFELQANVPQSLEATRPVAAHEINASVPSVVIADPVVIPVAPLPQSTQTQSVTTPHKEKSQGLNIPIASTQKQAKAIPAVATPKNKPQGISIPVTPFPSVQTESSAVPSAVSTNTTANQFTTAQIQPVKSTVQAANRELTYQVKAGDTLDSIAQSYRVSKAELIRINDLHNPDEIRVNQTLKIPFNKSKSVKTAVKPQVITPVVPETPDVNNQSVAINVNSTNSTKRSTPSSSTAINSQSNPYIERLKQDIIKLRQQYQNQNSNNSNTTASVKEIPPSPVVTQPVTPAVIAPTPTLNNPEFSSGSYKSNSQKVQQPIKVEPPTQKVQQPVKVEPPTQVAETSIPITVEPPPANTSITKTQVPTVVVPKKQVVASTPIPVETYNPNLKQPVGTTVSPDSPFNNSPDTDPNNVRPFQGYIWPAKGVLTSGYGWRWGRMHKGIDIAAPVGTPVYAAAPGVIEYARWNSGGYGNLVDIRHADGSLTRYGHNSRILVREGDTVAQGQQIAEMGSTGFSTGPHSHFEIHPPGKGAVNPIAFLPRR